MIKTSKQYTTVAALLREVDKRYATQPQKQAVAYLREGIIESFRVLYDDFDEELFTKYSSYVRRRKGVL